jgi:cytochrome b561
MPWLPKTNTPGPSHARDAVYRTDTSWAERLNPAKGRHWSWAAAFVFGLALMIWITTQVAMIGGGSWLQPLYFGVGLAILALSLAPSVRRYLSAPSQRPPSQPGRGSAR